MSIPNDRRQITHHSNSQEASHETELAGRRLLVMSNRAPIRLVGEGPNERIEPTVGGVGSTFLRLLERHGGLWIAWPGGHKAAGHLPFPPGQPRFAISFVTLSERDVSLYYYGLCNRALWPLMHSMIANTHFNINHWRQYQLVNKRFAERAVDEAGQGDALWIQDFHLALTPRMIRAKRADLPIGIFWHVPFPPVELYMVFPWRKELLEGMLGSDLIGFHTRGYATHFLDACERVLGAQVNRKTGEIRYQGHVTHALGFPLGIPVDYFEELAANPKTRERASRIRRQMRSEILVLGVDRLDYTKGILERLLGFERFLDMNPAYHRRVTLVLIAVPSRTKVSDYMTLKRQVDETVGRVIGKFSSAGWVPIRYLYTQFGAEELVAHYAAADVALLTPLRDGMNLVAKEFVASHPGDDAVLILSEFAGAAEELTEALLVNPYDADAVALRIKEAIEMNPDERKARMRALRDKVRSNNLERWSADFLRTLTRESAVGSRPVAQTHTA